MRLVHRNSIARWRQRQVVRSWQLTLLLLLRCRFGNWCSSRRDRNRLRRWCRGGLRCLSLRLRLLSLPARRGAVCSTWWHQARALEAVQDAVRVAAVGLLRRSRLLLQWLAALLAWLATGPSLAACLDAAPARRGAGSTRGTGPRGQSCQLSNYSPHSLSGTAAWQARRPTRNA